MASSAAGSLPRRVPREDLRQFASRFQTPAGLPFYAIVRGGSMSPLGMALADIKRLDVQLRACREGQPEDCAAARAAAREHALIQARDAVDALRSEAP